MRFRISCDSSSPWRAYAIVSDSQVMFVMTDSFPFSPSDQSQSPLSLQTTPIRLKTSSLSTPCFNEHLRFSLARNCVISITCSAECFKFISKTFSCHCSFCTEAVYSLE